ncbi:FAD-dependent monooxygenase [Sphingomonas sp. BK235]|uniref:FAD-dependent monooxygenase n=1 Tax=Sphingomonas sp. BK235 TaxID=2512131 RepID=UPI00104FE370|nr:FAD-dependent monooxygenase [Sphingomonas sp. BK235]TCP31888.1 2-polyprenyl-6-methoxyphenol hydroxylase-like FAD-dependent oxidoreductase [Sphingomonas sp. BK235]
MSISSDRPVVIVGGGIAGLALARALTARAIPFLLVERRAGDADGGLAINLPGNAIRALDRLGLAEEIARRGHPVGRRDYRTAADRSLFTVDEDAFWGEAARPRVLRRAALLAMLGDGLAPHRLRRGVAVDAIVPHEDRVDVTLDDGTAIAVALVVGADGVHSAVRAGMLAGGSAPDHALLAAASWRFMAPDPGPEIDPDLAGWTVWGSRDGLVLLMPLGDGEIYGWAAVTRAPRRGAAPATLAALAAGFPERVRAVVARARVHHAPLEEVRLARWSAGRVALIGDAAHATAPVWAQGAALAMEDALVLADCLARDADALVALAAYERRRRPRVAHVQAMTDAMSRAARLPVAVRDLLLPRLGPRRYARTYGPLRADA